jgi:D-apionolactonase
MADDFSGSDLLSRRNALHTMGVGGALAALTATGGYGAVMGEPLQLQAGSLRVLFDPATLSLRYVRAGELELVRTIYPAVRNGIWGTVPPKLSDTKLEQTADGFVLTFAAECVEKEIDFVWAGRIEGSAAGKLSYSVKGEARKAFSRNRIGFCVLHPLQGVAGAECEILHTDGRAERGRFPADVSPHQPYLDIRAVTHYPAPGLACKVLMEGDAFEMEDHRNWTDGSFKTYCTPLALPYPVPIAAGAKVEQQITVELSGKSAAPSTARAKARTAADVVRITEAGAAAMSMPGFGLLASYDDAPLGAEERRLLLALQPGHLRVDLWPKNRLAAAAAEARALGAGLEVGMVLGEDPAVAVNAWRAALQEHKDLIRHWLCFTPVKGNPNAAWIAACRAALGPLQPKASFAFGTQFSFVEANRVPPPAASIDEFCFSITPVVHAVDDLTLIENLEAQAHVVRSARRLAQGKPVVVSPVTMELRYNANNADFAGTLPGDRRMRTDYGAGWTLGSLKYLAEAGARRITLYETRGERGVQTAGRAHPLYAVLREFRRDPSAGIVPVTTSQPLALEALLLRGEKGSRLLVANLTEKPLRFAGKASGLLKAREFRVLSV